MVFSKLFYRNNFNFIPDKIFFLLLKIHFFPEYVLDFCLALKHKTSIISINSIKLLKRKWLWKLDGKSEK